MIKTETITRQQVVDLIMTLPPDRLASVYDFALFIKAHPLAPTAVTDILGETEALHLAEALEGLFTNPENGWFTPLTVAVAGLTAAEAATVPTPGFNSVWAVVNHVRFWQEFALHRLCGRPVDRQALGAEDGWPPVGDPADEERWRTACEQATAVNRELAALVAGLTDAELGQPTAPGWARRHQVIHGVIAHNSYHTNEIISLRHMLGRWLERV